jgi:hypothetical protein
VDDVDDHYCWDHDREMQHMDGLTYRPKSCEKVKEDIHRKKYYYIDRLSIVSAIKRSGKSMEKYMREISGDSDFIALTNPLEMVIC